MRMDWISESHNMVDIIHGVIPYNGLEYKIIESSIFSRLHRVFQSSLAYLTYPSNKVHRFEHSMGVMHLSGEFFYRSICNSSDANINKLLEEVETGLLGWLKSGQTEGINDQMKADIQKKIKSVRDFEDTAFCQELNCDLFRTYTPSNLPENKRFPYYVILEAVRLVGLLHDLGHMPYSHITEYALHRLYDRVSAPDDTHFNELNAQKVEDYLGIVKKYCVVETGDHEIHEAIGTMLVSKIFTSIIETFPSGAGHQHELLFVASVFYLTKEILTSSSGDNSIFADLHRIVAGVIDCDRMDYCCRDLFCAGVSKEFPRYERIFYTVQLLYHAPPRCDHPVTGTLERERCYFAFTTKATGQIEQLLLRRWEDYTTINYHHRVHKHEILLELVIAQLGYESLCKKDEAEERESSGILPFDISSLWKVIDEIQSGGAVDISVSQLDDEWLNTLLRYQYFQRYGDTYNARSENRNERRWNRLDELITGQRHYRSLFKRSGGFQRFDRAFIKAYGSEDAVNDSFDDELQKLCNWCPAKKYYEYVNAELDKWSQRQEVQDSLHIIDCVIGNNSFSSGIKATDMESIYMISSVEEIPPAPLDKRSRICKQLDDYKSLFPSFHVYYLPKYDMEHDEYHKVDRDALQDAIAEIAAVCMKELAESYSQKVSQMADEK